MSIAVYKLQVQDYYVTCVQVEQMRVSTTSLFALLPNQLTRVLSRRATHDYEKSLSENDTEFDNLDTPPSEHTELTDDTEGWN